MVKRRMGEKEGQKETLLGTGIQLQKNRQKLHPGGRTPGVLIPLHP